MQLIRKAGFLENSYATYAKSLVSMVPERQLPSQLVSRAGFVTTYGAKIDLLSQRKFTALMHTDGCLNPCYGMTELSCIGACYPWPEQDIDGSIGYFLPNLEVK